MTLFRLTGWPSTRISLPRPAWRHVAAIGTLSDIEAILDGKAGTVITPSGSYSPVAGSRR
jgi:hypothetical protein